MHQVGHFLRLLCRGMSETSTIFYFAIWRKWNNCGFSLDLKIGTAFLCSVVAIRYLMLRKFQKGAIISWLPLNDQCEICKNNSYLHCVEGCELWGCRSSGIWRCVSVWLDVDVLRQPATSSSSSFSSRLHVVVQTAGRETNTGYYVPGVSQCLYSQWEAEIYLHLI